MHGDGDILLHAVGQGGVRVYGVFKDVGEEAAQVGLGQGGAASGLHGHITAYAEALRAVDVRRQKKVQRLTAAIAAHGGAADLFGNAADVLLRLFGVSAGDAVGYVLQMVVHVVAVDGELVLRLTVFVYLLFRVLCRHFVCQLFKLELALAADDLDIADVKDEVHDDYQRAHPLRHGRAAAVHQIAVHRYHIVVHIVHQRNGDEEKLHLTALQPELTHMRRHGPGHEQQQGDCHGDLHRKRDLRTAGKEACDQRAAPLARDAEQIGRQHGYHRHQHGAFIPENEDEKQRQVYHQRIELEKFILAEEEEHGDLKREQHQIRGEVLLPRLPEAYPGKGQRQRLAEQQHEGEIDQHKMIHSVLPPFR